MKLGSKAVDKLKLTRTYFSEFAKSQEFTGVLLIVCTIASLTLANSSISESWLSLLHSSIYIFDVPFIVNDILMSLFFLLVGLEIKRELSIGELSKKKSAALPIAGAIGGMIVPACIFTFFNAGNDTINGWAIPTATDIAFAVGIMNLFGKKVPLSLKIFITALAVVDDLGAVLIIALFYSQHVNMYVIAMLIFLIPLSYYILKNSQRYRVALYVNFGLLFLFLLHAAHLHTTLAGMILAAVTPFSNDSRDEFIYKVEHFLHKAVNFFIVPLFAIVNTAIIINMKTGVFDTKLLAGIFLGLFLGKPLGITLFSYIATKLKLAVLPSDANIKDLFLVSILGGIGFTMSIFISLLAFTDVVVIEQSKLYVLIGSAAACIVGAVVLNKFVSSKF